MIFSLVKVLQLLPSMQRHLGKTCPSHKLTHHTPLLATKTLPYGLLNKNYTSSSFPLSVLKKLDTDPLTWVRNHIHPCFHGNDATRYRQRNEYNACKLFRQETGMRKHFQTKLTMASQLSIQLKCNRNSNNNAKIQI